MARVTRKRKPEAPPASPLAALMEKHLQALRVLNYSEYTVKNRRVHLGFSLPGATIAALRSPRRSRGPSWSTTSDICFTTGRKTAVP